MPLDPLRVKTIFQSALELSDPAGRPAFLDDRCGGDGELRARVVELLAAHDRPASALDRPLAGDPSTGIDPYATSDGGSAGTNPDPYATVEVSDPSLSFLQPAGSVRNEYLIAGRYRLRQEIGEGGMGTVFLADQTQPVKRQVALKLIRQGMDSRTVLARFDAERQALALMDHPNIAKVLDAGATEDGRPFFVMELVKGIPLTDYCDQHRLGLPERLVLFRQICSAVQHAHQKGIIHRDLKPTNILVESHDEKPVPKVIDFGLAKATGGLQLGDQSLYTAFGSVAGTPLYMAPEQASFNALDIDTRADIYSLGVILYELLTGTTPIPRESIRRVALDEMMRVIREVEPPTPSSRIGSSDTLPGVAATRQTEPARLGRFLRGDLDWIVMKALAKERQRRYDSPMALADDIERFTNHEPVSAGPPTASYRLRKFVRRNRGRVTAAAIISVVLTLGVIGTIFGLVQARQQRTVAVKQRNIAERRLAQIEQTNAILGSIFNDLDPSQVKQGKVPLSAILGKRLDKASAEIEGESIGDPMAVARLQLTLAKAQFGLGYMDKAIVLYSKAIATLTATLGTNHPDTLAARHDRALVYQVGGQDAVALEELKGVLAAQKAQNKPGLMTTVSIAQSLIRLSKAREAIALLEPLLPAMRATHGPQDATRIHFMAALGWAYETVLRVDEAMPLLNEAAEGARATFGPDHRATIGVMTYQALGYEKLGQNARAVEIFEEVIASSRATIGTDHHDFLTSSITLGSIYLMGGKAEKGIPLIEEALPQVRAKLGIDHPTTLMATNNLAKCYEATGRFDLAVPLLEENLKQVKAKLGPDHVYTFSSMVNLAQVYLKAKRPADAFPIYEALLADARKRSGADRSGVVGITILVAADYIDGGQFAAAESLLRECLEIQEKRQPDDWRTYSIRSMLGEALLGQKKFIGAAPLMKSGYKGLKARFDKIPPNKRDNVTKAIDRLIALAEATNKPEDAKAWREERAKLSAPGVPKAK